ncbi:MAG TPA: hypothetical protein VGN41_17780 [Streptosporangiaceae bacterium]
MARRRRGVGTENLSALEYLGKVQDRRFTQWLATTARNRRALKERRANLDQRVQRGQISPGTRARHLAAHRRQARRLRDDGSPLWWPGRLLRWFSLKVFPPVVALALLIVGGIDLEPAYAAAHGYGTLGYFIAVRADVCKHPPYCTWTGTFTSDNGQDFRQNVQLDGTWNLGTGLRILALDSGDPGVVFPRTGTGLWRQDLGRLAIGTLIMVPWLWFIPGRRLRRMRWANVMRGPPIR